MQQHAAREPPGAAAAAGSTVMEPHACSYAAASPCHAPASALTLSASAEPALPRQQQPSRAAQSPRAPATDAALSPAPPAAAAPVAAAQTLPAAAAQQTPQQAPAAAPAATRARQPRPAAAAAGEESRLRDFGAAPVWSTSALAAGIRPFPGEQEMWASYGPEVHKRRRLRSTLATLWLLVGSHCFALHLSVSCSMLSCTSSRLAQLPVQTALYA